MAALRFSASRAEQLIACPGSADLELSIPGFTLPEVDETVGAKGKGSELHKWLAETGKLKASDLRKLVEALAYYSEIRGQRRFKVLAEETVKAEWFQTKPKTTVAQVLYVQDELHIIEWKTGEIQVYAEDNKQLMFYAACFLHLAPKAEGVWLHIIQPWAKEGSSSWYCSAAELQLFMQEAQEAEQKIIDKDTTLSPSDHCTFCPANPHSRGDKGRPLCPSMMNMLYPSYVDEQAVLDL